MDTNEITGLPIDKNFHGSAIQKEDFLVYRIKDFLKHEEKVTNVKVAQLVDIKACTLSTLGEMEADIFDGKMPTKTGKFRKNQVAILQNETGPSLAKKKEKKDFLPPIKVPGVNPKDIVDKLE